MSVSKKRSGIWQILLLAFIGPFAGYSWKAMQRPDFQAIAPVEIFEGITYQRQVNSDPRPYIVHIIAIDLTTPGVAPYVTPGFEGAVPNARSAPIKEVLAQPTSDFLLANGLQLAINANYFFPFEEKTPWHFGPRTDDAANVIGEAISNGETVSLPYGNYSTLCFLAGRAEIVTAEPANNVTNPENVTNNVTTCPTGTQQAIAGQPLDLTDLAENERTQAYQPRGNLAKPYPVNIAGLDASGQKLWLVLADGKQPLYSEGMTVVEAIALLQSLGATTALKLDGGGSTTLAIEGRGVVNAVIHTKVPGWERPVANHLGFFANPAKD